MSVVSGSVDLFESNGHNSCRETSDSQFVAPVHTDILHCAIPLEHHESCLTVIMHFCVIVYCNYRVTTLLEFLKTWKCQGILNRSGKRHTVRERSGNLCSR